MYCLTIYHAKGLTMLVEQMYKCWSSEIWVICKFLQKS